MKVALVHEYLTNFSGSEQVLLSLHQMFPSAPIFTAIYDPANCPQFNKATVYTSFLQKFPRFLAKAFIPLLPLAVEGYDLSDYDLIISDSHIAAKGVITKVGAVHICYCHTPIRYAWSSEIDPRANRNWLGRLASHYLRIWDFYASQRVDYFIANSNGVAQRIKKFYRRDSVIIHPPVNTQLFKAPLNNEIGDYYILYGRLIDYKKPDLVIKAFNKLGIKLIVLGRGPMLAKLQSLAGKNIEFLDRFLPTEQLAKLLAGAKAMVFLAEEDFGISMVDVMACGRPVLAYKAGGAIDIVKPGLTGEFIEEQTVSAIVKAVENFDPLRYDKNVIQAQANRFDEQIFKQKIADFIDKNITLKE